jgi:tRNA uridine 5-carboxymethylaminomethyl modification enzyme
MAEETSVSPAQALPLLGAAGEPPLAHSVRAAELARRPRVHLGDLLRAAGRLEDFDEQAAISVELELKYSGYFERERAQAERLRRMRDFVLPPELSYEDMRSLSTEARQKLGRIKPGTLSQAASVPGVSASDLQNLVLEVERWKRN